VRVPAAAVTARSGFLLAATLREDTAADERTDKSHDQDTLHRAPP
jgi:hypothetical protein